MIKGGEWKLGSDEEPLKFQLIRVKTITVHPRYQPGSFNFDVALLHLEESLNFQNNIEPLCLDEQELSSSSSSQDCVTTGWGKDVLKGKQIKNIIIFCNFKLIN